jgi:hypothetical protein
MKTKRLVVISDLHCGHVAGLTPPEFDRWAPEGLADLESQYLNRRYIWDWFEKQVKSLGKVDVLIANGDMLDGKGPASGGTEQLYMSYEQQADMAAAVIGRFAGSPSVNMSFGTGYHTGKEEDWESVLARQIGAEKIGDEDNIEINGLVLNYKHHLGTSQVPYGRATAVLRDKFWKDIWALRGEYPKVDVVIRSHVHYHQYTGGPDFLAMTTPALQGYGSKYARRMSGTVDIGFVVFDISSKEDYDWYATILRMPYKEARAV